jgi:hypothetical protein
MFTRKQFKNIQYMCGGRITQIKKNSGRVLGLVEEALLRPIPSQPLPLYVASSNHAIFYSPTA